MKHLVFMLLAWGIIITGCQQESISPQVNQSELAPRSSQQRPFKGTLIYYYDALLDAPECDCSVVGGDLRPGGYAGSGQVTHLGLVNSEISECFIAGGALDCPVGNHATKLCPTFIAANGDELFLDFDPLDLCVDLECFCQAYGSTDIDIVGGTGRFEDASGELTVELLADFSTGAYTLDFDGYIVY